MKDDAPAESEPEGLTTRIRLGKAIAAAENLASKFRFADAVEMLDGIRGSVPSEDTVKNLVVSASALRSQIVQRRQVFLIRLYLAAAAVLSFAVIGALYFMPVSSIEIVAAVQTDGLFAKVENGGFLSIGGLDGLIVSNTSGVTAHSSTADVIDNGSTGALKTPPAIRSVKLNSMIPASILPLSGIGNFGIVGEDLAVVELRLFSGYPLEIMMGNGSSRTVTLTHNASQSSATIETGGPARVSCDNCSLSQNGRAVATGLSEVRIDPLPQEFQLDNPEQSTDFTFHYDADGASARDKAGFLDAITVSEIDFTAQRSGQVVSLVRSGTIEITEIDGRAVNLVESEFLDLQGLSDFHVTEVRIGETLEVRIRGYVTSFWSGFGKQLHSRMPSKLEWLLANESVALFFGALSALFAFIVAALVKFRFIDKA